MRKTNRRKTKRNNKTKRQKGGGAKTIEEILRGDFYFQFGVFFKLDEFEAFLLSKSKNLDLKAAYNTLKDKTEQEIGLDYVKWIQYYDSPDDYRTQIYQLFTFFLLHRKINGVKNENNFKKLLRHADSQNRSRLLLSAKKPKEEPSLKIADGRIQPIDVDDEDEDDYDIHSDPLREVVPHGTERDQRAASKHTKQRKKEGEVAMATFEKQKLKTQQLFREQIYNIKEDIRFKKEALEKFEKRDSEVWPPTII